MPADKGLVPGHHSGQDEDCLMVTFAENVAPHEARKCGGGMPFMACPRDSLIRGPLLGLALLCCGYFFAGCNDYPGHSYSVEDLVFNKGEESLKDLKDVVLKSFQENNPEQFVSISYYNTDVMPPSYFSDELEALGALANLYSFSSVESASAQEFTPPMKLPGEWKRKNLKYILEPEWWLLVYGGGKLTENPEGPDLWEMVVYVPVIKVDGLYYIPGVAFGR